MTAFSSRFFELKWGSKYLNSCLTIFADDPFSRKLLFFIKRFMNSYGNVDNEDNHDRKILLIQVQT